MWKVHSISSKGNADRFFDFSFSFSFSFHFISKMVTIQEKLDVLENVTSAIVAPLLESKLTSVLELLKEGNKQNPKRNSLAVGNQNRKRKTRTSSSGVEDAKEDVKELENARESLRESFKKSELAFEYLKNLAASSLAVLVTEETEMQMSEMM
jgi:hypothetical protein